jgi:LmbE family N-acetylglucosaminyl deacetylase
MRLPFVFLLVAAIATGPTVTLPQDAGVAGTWHKLLKLRTTASVLHTTAHPDDEHGGLLAMISRRDGARLALMTLNRGESGDNAIGPQLFDALGLIRTEELRIADRYYGVDDQYFTTVVDYGFSKRLDEALDKWGRENVLRDVVRVIRINRPIVIISRFQGNSRDGHGNHQTAGLITQEAYKAAADPAMFPEQIKEGLRPWQALKLYMGGVRENEDWTIRVDTGEYSPWLADSYNNFARIGLGFQRSQNSGRVRRVSGASYGYYKRLDSKVQAPAKEESVFDGIDTTHAGLFKMLGNTASAGAGAADAGGADAAAALAAIDAAAKRAIETFTAADPSSCVPALVDGLKATRAALRVGSIAAGADAAFILRIKEQQFQDAINAAMGIELTAVAQPANVPEPTGPFASFMPAPTMGPVYAGETFEVRADLASHGGRVTVTPPAITLKTATGWNVSPLPGPANANARFSVTLTDAAALTSKPYFSRQSIADSRYTLSDPKQFGRPSAEPAAIAIATYTIGGEPIETREVVRRREPNLPYGDELRELMVVPRLALIVSPSSAIIPIAAAKKQLAMQVDLLNNVESGNAGDVTLTLPAGWTSTPASQPFTFARAGERATYRFTVSAPASIANQSYALQAVARERGTGPGSSSDSSGSREYREGYEILAQRDLETRYLYRPSTATVRGIDVTTVPGLKVGYVMGVGDQVPAGIAQLGAEVTLLTTDDLATGDLKRFDSIMTGTRAYAVRDDLKTYNQRLLDYVKAGGNLIVLYNTPEFVPTQWAPFPARLPDNAEEVSEEDSPIDILAPDHQVFNWPNKITKADFDNWVEQRGSKFFSEWDKAYTPMISTFDRAQPPQRGGWLWARHGQGHYTYFAYALHRQLPSGVPGAYRLLANLLALNKKS